MKKIPFSIFILLCSIQVFAQVIYVSATDNTLYKLDINTCNYEYIVKVQKEVFDITFHPDGNLYGISGNGNFFRIDTLSGSVSQVHDFNGQNFNSLTTAGNGLIYTTGSAGLLWSYDIGTDNAVYYGDMGHKAAGDLTFYNGELYAAIIGDRIALVDIDNPPNTSIIIDQVVPGDIFGIVSFAEDCSDVNSYAITNGNSDIYQIDYTNNALNFVCALGIEIGGGASTFEFIASNPIVINDLDVTIPICNLLNGGIFIDAVGGIGNISYSIDGLNFQESGTFDNLGGGVYAVVIQDENGCVITEEVELAEANTPEITDFSFENASCENNNGSIMLFGSGGIGLLEYSIDGINFQNDGIFDNLPPETYIIVVQDSENCRATETIEIINNASPSLGLTQVINTSCNLDNGFFQVDVTGGTLPFTFTLDGSNYQEANSFENLTSGEFMVLVEDMNGCQDSLAVIIEPSETPLVETINTTSTICGEDNGSLQITGIGGSGKLQFSLNDVEYQEENLFEDLASGEYTIYIKDEIGCIISEMDKVGGSDKLLIQSIDITLADCGEDNGSFMIETRGGNNLKTISLNGDLFQSDFLYTDLISDMYEVQIMNELGCTLDTIVVVSQQECPIYIPNVFSPNEDGVNDLFSIYPHPGFVGDFSKLMVFDRWGSVVFNAKNFIPNNMNWDGTYDGEELEIGVYSFYLEYILEGNIKKVRTGDITLLKI